MYSTPVFFSSYPHISEINSIRISAFKQQFSDCITRLEIKEVKALIRCLENNMRDSSLRYHNLKILVEILESQILQERGLQGALVDAYALWREALNDTGDVIRINGLVEQLCYNIFNYDKYE